MTAASTSARELGAFLRSRREQTRPEDLGLEPGPRRRVGGLRREEVAVLAGLSTDYYQRLEQGRNVRPSDAVLDSIADALDLDDVERRHLMMLARAARRPSPPRRRARERVPDNARLLIASLALPAFAVNRHLDVLAWNGLAAELLGDPLQLPPSHRNVLMTLFRDDESRLRCAGWETMALDYIGMLRAAVALDPDHPRAVAIIGELSIQSAEFRRMWARHHVRESVHGAKTIRHPRIGEIDVEWDAYPIPGVPGAHMIVFAPQPGHEDRLQLLAAVSSLDATTRPTENPRKVRKGTQRSSTSTGGRLATGPHAAAVTDGDAP
ncbi:helix-turn-helix transcriptional regulator [Myceligenerans pegani]|uniref:Helix-turn-helix domain-containing protein n=1 Tax=Myceligenerans pegani TaxID=2776917 RepID=A0ABR9MWE4_9MICO|nr:helix-turn-helix transcriptional regulator [Myceligenerans sp. TRM 65318]MBE1875697.1 helix-turn-helix domain-containing protein [Myceligenerans sp. TRM 65318]MBE3017968.1 helix-turn-helix domain-containing protein [Myceligenerans sp. TRM 65318]